MCLAEAYRLVGALGIPFTHGDLSTSGKRLVGRRIGARFADGLLFWDRESNLGLDPV